MEKQKSGVIINISSDYGIISPNQNIYRKEGVAEEDQTIKPVSSVRMQALWALKCWLE